MITDLQALTENRLAREVPQSPALHREAPKAAQACVLHFQPYKPMTQPRVILCPRVANGAIRGRLRRSD